LIWPRVVRRLTSAWSSAHSRERPEISGGDVEEGARGGGDRELLVAAGIAWVEVGGAVDPDALAIAPALAAYEGDVDVTVEEWPDAPDGRCRVVAEEGALAARKDCGVLYGERRKNAERHH